MFRSFLVLFVVLFSFGFSHGGKGGAIVYPNTEECTPDLELQKEYRKNVLMELQNQDWFKDCELNHCSKDTIVDYSVVKNSVSIDEQTKLEMWEYHIAFNEDPLMIRFVDGEAFVRWQKVCVKRSLTEDLGGVQYTHIPFHIGIKFNHSLERYIEINYGDK